MGKKNKKSKSQKSASKKKDADEVVKEKKKSKEPRITMQDLEEMSSGSEGSLPPEQEWDEEAQALKDMIMGGQFDHLLKREDGDGEDDDDDDDEIEEVELNSDYDDDDDVEEESDGEEQVEKDAEKQASKRVADSDSEKEDSSSNDSDVEEEDEPKKQADDDSESAEEEEGKDDEQEEAAEENDDEEEDEEESEKYKSIAKKNQVSSKALHLVTKELVAEKEGWHWGETFDIVPPTPLPFGHHAAKAQGGNPLDVHDDLKREVAFYDLALQAVHQGRAKCQKAGIPFSRPDDFFAEMVKSDDHMARVKDRLLFETKKMDAVAQRRSNKEQKLRSKEAHANKLAEKAKRKKDHFQAVEDWAASQREGGSRGDAAGPNGGGKNKGGNNKKRQRADSKFGFGGKRGRFKQNSAKSMNDMSGYNPAGNFAGGMKRTGGGSKSGSGAARKGKRARDASRSRR